MRVGIGQWSGVQKMRERRKDKALKDLRDQRPEVKYNSSPQLITPDDVLRTQTYTHSSPV